MTPKCSLGTKSDFGSLRQNASEQKHALDRLALTTMQKPDPSCRDGKSYKTHL